MMKADFTISWLGRRRHEGALRIWGWGTEVATGRLWTFWLVDGNWSFKPADTYTQGFRRNREHDGSIPSLVAEKRGKGYADAKLTPYYRRMVNMNFGLCRLLGAVHLGRRNHAA